MADLKNTSISGTGFDTIPSGTTAQRPSPAVSGMIRFNTSFNEIEYYNGTSWINPNTGAMAGLGQSSATAAQSARQIKAAYPDAADGVYWIDLPSVGAKQIYCLMDDQYDGGSWMMAMKATRGTTFRYSSNYWTTANVLNDTTQINRNDADAKFDTMNYFQALDIMATWPDLTGGGGSIPAASEHVWLENGFYGNRITLISFFNTVTRWFVGDARLFPGWQGNGFTFSSQTDIRFYGFNWDDNRPSRWGFGWNENGGGLFPNGVERSDDVEGGIGLASTNNYSAGDRIYCCQNVTGFNRSARVEIWIR